jgi:transposase
MSHSKIAFTDWREARRKRAFELAEQGWTQRAIAQALGVSEAAISQWFAIRESSANDNWRSRPRGHRNAALSSAQLKQLPDRLSHGAEAYGFRGELWTCARVAEVIRQEFGITYHKAHVSRLLKALQWTPQLPVERASQRDEVAIQRWRIEVWPLLKKRLSKMA